MTTLHIEVREDLLGKHVEIDVKGAGSGKLLAWAMERFAADRARVRYAELPSSYSEIHDTGLRESASTKFLVLADSVLNGPTE